MNAVCSIQMNLESWKSSQIEGNTYSLLETERLLKEKVTASGKTKEEAIIIQNHEVGGDFQIVLNLIRNLSIRIL